jgi:HK97 gp10 family phage protein
MPYVGGSLTTLFDEIAQAATAEAARKMAEAGGDHIIDIAKINTPVRSGRLRSAWRRSEVEPDSVEGHPAFRVTVSNPVDYAAYVEYGTGLYGPKHAPYVIKPRNPGGTLRFVGRDGNVVFAKSVLHPGSPGNYMLAIAMDVTHAAVEGQTIFRTILEKWVRDVEGGAH